MKGKCKVCSLTALVYTHNNPASKHSAPKVTLIYFLFFSSLFHRRSVNNDGANVLDVAVMNNHVALAKMLQQAGAMESNGGES